MELTLGTDKEGLLMCSGKTGEGTPALLEAIIQRIPPPKGDRNAGMCAMLFDTWFDKYRGVVCLLRSARLPQQSFSPAATIFLGPNALMQG